VGRGPVRHPLQRQRHDRAVTSPGLRLQKAQAGPPGKTDPEAQEAHPTQYEELKKNKGENDVSNSKFDPTPSLPAPWSCAVRVRERRA
jgi:hypothetical protein